MDRLTNKGATVDNKEKPVKRYSGILGFIFRPALKIIDNVESDYRDRSLTKKTFIALLKLKAPVCIFMAIVFVFASFYFFIKSKDQSTMIMSLNYEESASGLNPNATRFNAYDVKKQAIVEKMLYYCGIDPADVDVNEVMNSISITPTNSKGFSKDSYYIATSYRISIKKMPLSTDISANDVLSLLCRAYKDNLYANYTENRSILEFDMGDFSDIEYMEIADLFNLKIQQIEKYLNTRLKQSKSFTEEKSDESFKSLSQKVEDLQNYDISNYRAFVLQAGLSQDKARYTTALEYVNMLKELSFNKDMVAYDVRNDGIKLYNDAMISIVMIPSIDKSKNTYYMSKTKTGMDYMAKQADDYLLTAQETAKEIATNDDIIVKMSAGKNRLYDIKKAQDMITIIRQKFTELSKQVETVDKAYVKYKTKDYVTFKMSEQSFIQRLNPDMLILLMAAAGLGIFGVIWLRFRYLSGGVRS